MGRCRIRIFVYCENVHRQEKTNKKNDNGEKNPGKLLFLDESRVWNLSVPAINREKSISCLDR